MGFLYIYIIYLSLSLSLSIYIYIYIQGVRERERERERLRLYSLIPYHAPASCVVEGYQFGSFMIAASRCLARRCTLRMGFGCLVGEPVRVRQMEEPILPDSRRTNERKPPAFQCWGCLPSLRTRHFPCKVRALFDAHPPPAAHWDV